MKKNETPYAAAIRLLSMRAMAAWELREGLLRRGYAPEDAEDAVTRVTEAGFIDEAAYAEALVRRYTQRGYGPRALPARLRQHGLPADVIAAALQPIEPDGDALDTLARKFLRGENTEKSRQRAAAALARRGFPIHEINAALRRVCGAVDGVLEDE